MLQNTGIKNNNVNNFFQHENSTIYHNEPYLSEPNQAFSSSGTDPTPCFELRSFKEKCFFENTFTQKTDDSTSIDNFYDL